jgi:poly-gamma-glutamate capsule biosynthesis protein CapA/YwtB (metallophosphatase superfamily)
MRYKWFILSCFYFIFYSCGNENKVISLEKKQEIEELDSLVYFDINFVGDIMQHIVQVNAARVDQDIYNYEPCFRFVKGILSADDLTVGNLELTLNGLGPFSGFPFFKSPDTLAWFLKEAGFDLILTANNHSNDNGYFGISHTLEVLEKFKIKSTGTFRDSSERLRSYPLLLSLQKKKQSLQLAILNCTFSTNGIPTTKPAIVNGIDTNQILLDVKAAQDKGAEFIIMCIHWGNEYALTPSGEQRKIARWLIDHGIDLIVGAHPHVIQNIEIDSVELNAKKKTVPVFYSLGNFVSNQQDEHTNFGLIAGVRIFKNQQNSQVGVHDLNYIPVFRYIRKHLKKSYHVLPISATLSDTVLVQQLSVEDYQKIKSGYDALIKRIGNQVSEKKFNFSDHTKKIRRDFNP